MAVAEFFIGLDIGGHSAKIGVVDARGKVLAHERVTNAGASSARGLVDRYGEAIDRLVAAVSPGASPAGIGVGVPGYVSAEGRPEFTNVGLLNGYDLARHLGERYRVRVRLDNDANLAALAEYHRGAGRGSRRLMMVTVGTGIGVAVVADGSLIKFTGGSTGNIGHLIVDPFSMERCSQGCRGCLETLATAPAMRRRALIEAGRRPNGFLGRRLAEAGVVDVPDVGAAALAGDEGGLTIVRETGWWLGVGLASFVAVFAPDRVIIGGGVSELGRPLLDGAREALARVGMPAFAAAVSVGPAALGNDAGFIGAAWWAQAGAE
jgi:glucokinase